MTLELDEWFGVGRRRALNRSLRIGREERKAGLGPVMGPPGNAEIMHGRHVLILEGVGAGPKRTPTLSISPN